MNTDNPQTIDAFNRLSREVNKALLYWENNYPRGNKDSYSYYMMRDDEEVREAIRNLIESIINEHES